MKKSLLFLIVICVSACAHTSEQIVGYNEEGLTLVRVCTSYGEYGDHAAYGSDCKIELRDYGRISNPANTVNIISNNNR